MNKTAVVGRECEEESSPDVVGRPATSLRDSIKWLQATTLTDITTLLVWSGYGMTVRYCYILGVHYWIIKLYTTSKRLLETVKWCFAYHVSRVCDNFQTIGEDEDQIVGGTVHKQGSKERHRTNMPPAPLYFEKNHTQKDCIV